MVGLVVGFGASLHGEDKSNRIPNPYYRAEVSEQTAVYRTVRIFRVKRGASAFAEQMVCMYTVVYF